MPEKNYNARNRNFASLGLGLFVHYGIYSVLGEGEWVKTAKHMSDEAYDKLADKFAPSIHFTDDICSFAKKNGFKYVVLTTRHHDGFSLYDTKGLNSFDARHYLGRDLVKEFVDACRKYDIIPILYHTLIDWREEKKYTSFSEYLQYLRDSINILCSHYGQIGGFWFDGQWQYPSADWEEDKLYEIIRQKQPSAVIVNNAGLSRLGERMSSYIDVVTYERSDISNYNYSETIDHYAAEMCQALNTHWGYAKRDINYKPVKEILYNFCTCRKSGGNFLLNVGPQENGEIRPIEKEIITLFGDWIKLHGEAVYDTVPYPIELPSNVFALRRNNTIYIFIEDVPMEIDANAGRYIQNPVKINLGNLPYKSATWLDDSEKIQIDPDNSFTVKPYEYGTSLLIRVAKIELIE